MRRPVDMLMIVGSRLDALCCLFGAPEIAPNRLAGLEDRKELKRVKGLGLFEFILLLF